MLMYFLCFLMSHDFEIVWFSHEIISFALLLLFSLIVKLFRAQLLRCMVVLNSNSIGWEFRFCGAMNGLMEK